MTQQEGRWTGPGLPAPTRGLRDPGLPWAWLTELSEDRRRHVTVAEDKREAGTGLSTSFRLHCDTIPEGDRETEEAPNSAPLLRPGVGGG